MLRESDPEVYRILKQEEEKQRYTIGLIPSENIVSRDILRLAGSIFTNKYAEGYPGRRYYGGCKYIDKIEALAVKRACSLFSSEHANVQPHSGSQANMACYFASLKPGDKILAMNINSGGHLTHGLHLNFSGMFYNAVFYDVDRETEMIDYENIREIALKEKPKMLICGASSYSRIIDFKKVAAIAKEVGALMLADIAHISGLVIAKIHPTPVDLADFVTTTTHKTLRGPRGGLILCKAKYRDKLDNSIMPGIQGGPLMHIIAAKAVTFRDAMKPEFAEYQKQIVANSRKLCEEFMSRQYRVVSGGTDNHLMVIDLRNKGIKGSEFQILLESVGIISNKNLVPFDPEPPRTTSGIRFGTPLVTSRGMKEKEMSLIAEWIDDTLKYRDDGNVLKDIAKQVRRFAGEYPIYP